MRIDSSGNVLIGKTSDSDAAQGLSLYPSGSISYNDNNSGDRTPISFRRSGTQVGRIETNANNTGYYTTSSVSTGVALFNAGIAFPPTQVASGDANTLDDYEEGTWTPTLVFSGGAGTLSYATRTGYYTKIGRVVYVSINLIFSKGTASGTMDNISGLPFASGEAFGSGALIDNMSGLTGAPVWITQGSVAYIYMTNTGALGAINATSMGASSNVFRFAGYYNI